MKHINLIIAQIEKLEAKRDNFTITFEESAQLQMLIRVAEKLIY